MSEEDIVVENDSQGEVSEVASNEPSESEVKARRLGWMPKEEYKGNPDQWRDADEFLQRGEEIHGYLKADLQKLQQTISQRDNEIAEMRSAMEQFRQFHNETEARAYKRAIDELKQLKATAVSQGDGEKVVEIDEELDKLKEAQRKPEAPKQSSKGGDNGDFTTWIQENRWYAEDVELQEMADAFGDVVRRKNPSVTGKEFLDEVAKRVKKAAPEKFENPARSRAAVSSSSDSRPAGGSKKKGYNDLPAEAKAACDKFVKQKMLTVDQYLAEYEW